MKMADGVARGGSSAPTARVRRGVMPLGAFVVVVGLVASLHLGLWALKEPQPIAPSMDGTLPSVSYNRFTGHPSDGVPEEQIRTDLTAIAAQAKAVRTYSSTQGLERVPAIAAELGLTVTLGVWVDKDTARTEREIASALDLARRYPNVTRLVVGNETVYRHEITVADLIKIVLRVKRDSPIPVASAENWQTFMDHPEFSEAVDQIFAHIIPYWEGLPENTAVRDSLAIYDKLQAAYPHKKVVIGEFGWPSAGHNFESAVPDQMTQAVILRDFASRAGAREIDYNIVEAIDQPEKLFEGNVGPYWGIFDASLRPKFSWTGPIVDPGYWKAAWLAVLVGSLLSITILVLPGITVAQAGLLAVADHLFGGWCAALFTYWQRHYPLHGEIVTFAVALPLLGLLVPILRCRLSELATIVFGSRPAQLFDAAAMQTCQYTPKVSIHIPAYREPVEMLLETIDSVARLDYPNFECVVVVNNTPDPASWLPIESRCSELGPRFKFICVQDLVGFKAAALRLALSETGSDAEIIGVIDADYVVDPAWLKELVPGFADPHVGLIQAPQDHRDGDRSFIHTAMNAEYAGFFDIGMVERNEVNAIIVHGTMCLIRRMAMVAAGGWSSDTICEDSDLGLTIMEHGWRALYTNRRYGWGLLPQDYSAFRTQRSRWAGGAVQIVRKHWRRFLPGGSKLNLDQKREFSLGWLSWFGAEIIAVAAATFNLLWVPFVAFKVVAVPDALLTLPILAAFAVSLIHFSCSYQLRVDVPHRQMLGAMLMFMSVQWTVASAAFKAAFPKRPNHFHRTRKGTGAALRAPSTAMPEAVLSTLLVAGSVTIYATNIYRFLETDLFATILLVQSLPFLSAVALVRLERYATRKSREISVSAIKESVLSDE